MKRNALILLLAASTAAAIAQSPNQPAAPAARHTTAAKHATAVKHTTTAHKASTTKPAPMTTEELAFGIKTTDGVPMVRGIAKPMFTLRYKDVKIGTGPEAAHDKLYEVQYTGWIAATGRKFDSSFDHPRPPVMGKDHKPVLGPDGKPEQGPPQPIHFPQGYGRVIPGFDQGFAGMHVGGTRILYIPWQLGYGARGRPGPDAAHPGIPPYADLVFEIKLVSVTDMPTSPYGMMGGRPMPGMHGMHPMPGMHEMPMHEVHQLPAMHPMAMGTGAKPDAPAKAPAAATTPTAPAAPQSK